MRDSDVWRREQGVVTRLGRRDDAPFRHDVRAGDSTTAEWQFLKLAIRPPDLRAPRDEICRCLVELGRCGHRLVFLVLAHLEAPPDIIGIEDPEHALHPYLVGEVVEMLRRLAHGKLGPKAVQVVLATHSAQLLNFLEPEEVRFVSRSFDDGGAVVRAAPTDSAGWRSAYEEYQESLGEMWLSGRLGGVPGIAPTQ